jgi:hypothetical protein
MSLAVAISTDRSPSDSATPIVIVDHVPRQKNTVRCNGRRELYLERSSESRPRNPAQRVASAWDKLRPRACPP